MVSIGVKKEKRTLNSTIWCPKFFCIVLAQRQIVYGSLDFSSLPAVTPSHAVM